MPEADAAPTRLPKPESLEAKFKLAISLPYDARAKRKHMLVYGFILDWFHSKYGDALASVRHVVDTLKERDPTGQGLSAPHVHSALSDLVAWGYLHQDKGSGQRASRYVPNWHQLSDSVTPVGNTTDAEFSVTPGVNTTVTPVGNTTAISVHNVGNEDPSNPTRPQGQGTGIDGQDCAAPLAPLSAGLSAADAGPAQGGFEELWRAYDFKKKKKEARAAYDKVAPGAALHASMVESAKAWQASWAAQNKPDAPRFHLHKWIEREEYECSPPAAFRPKEQKAGPAAAKVPTKPQEAYPIRQRFTITGSNVEKEGWDSHLSIDVVDGDGAVSDMCFTLECKSEDAQYRGQKQFAALCKSVGLEEIEDSSQLHGRTFVRVLRSKFADYEYEPYEWQPEPRQRPRTPSFAEVVERTPMLGWASMIDTAYDDEDEAA